MVVLVWLFGFSSCLFFFKAWTLRSSYDLLTVLADTSVHSCLWLSLSGKDRQTLTVWHGLDTLEIHIFPFSKTKVKRGGDNLEIISLKPYLKLNLRLMLVLFFINHFASFSLLFEPKSFKIFQMLQS